MNNIEKIEQLETRVERLEQDLISCGIEKDVRIDEMHQDMLNVHKDMNAMKTTMEGLTIEIREAGLSLKQIAVNTANMRELANLYEKWKGFAWVMKSVGFWGAISISFIAGVFITILKSDILNVFK